MVAMTLDLDEIEARALAATAGPWRTGRSVGRTVYATYFAFGPDPGPLCLFGRPEDATFAAAARSDVPALVAEVRRLRELLALAKHNR